MHEQILRAVDLATAGRTDDALRLLRHITQTDPQQVAAWRWLAHLAPAPGEALYAARSLQKLAPDDPWLRDALPVLLERAGADGRQRTVPARWQPVAAGALLVAALLLMLSFALLVWRQADAPRQADAMLIAEDPVAASAAETASAQAPLAPPPSAEPRGEEAAPDGASVQALAAPELAVELSTGTNYYTFAGETEQDVREALYTQGPALQDGSQSIAMTSYQLWVEWNARQSVAACQMTRAVVHLDVTYTLPRWVPSGEPDGALYEDWERFDAHVAEHEGYHAELAEQCANQLAARLQEPPGFDTCGDIESWINTTVDDVYAVCEELQADFDAEEGRASFPLR